MRTVHKRPHGDSWLGPSVGLLQMTSGVDVGILFSGWFRPDVSKMPLWSLLSVTSSSSDDAADSDFNTDISDTFLGERSRVAQAPLASCNQEPTLVPRGMGRKGGGYCASLWEYVRKGRLLIKNRGSSA